jgi:hypothetical protein
LPCCRAAASISRSRGDSAPLTLLACVLDRLNTAPDRRAKADAELLRRRRAEKWRDFGVRETGSPQSQ